MRDLYFDGNMVVHKILVEQIRSHLHGYITRPNGVWNYFYCFDRAKMLAAAISLRAIHFDKTGKSPDEYANITQDMCQAHISKIKLVVQPIYEPIENYDLFKSEDMWYLPRINLDSYYVDALCYTYWKFLIENQSIEFSMDPDYVFNTIYDCIKPTDQDCQIIKAGEQERKRKAEIARQCDACAWSDSCQLIYERANCSAYMPK